MSWIGEFEEELRRRGVRAATRRRLLDEFSDHIACEQEVRIELTRLGAAREIAGQYAEELATDETRHAALGGFAALALAAIALLVSQAGLGRIGYPGFNHGTTTPLAVIAILAMVVGSQLALVAGTLAAWRALRRRREPTLPSAEIALIQRRTRLGIAAGLTTTAGILLYVVNFVNVLPAWWLALSGALAALASGALVAAWRTNARSAATVSLAPGPAGDVFDDLPPLRALRAHPLRLVTLATLTVGAAMTVVVWHAEHSLIEGLERGGFEALALAACFALFGRAIGARR
ncbi:MAG TPA: hypothetical protein VHX66_12075 [Solirubrobacteraceae bacterium]|jgi:hypothetical protein|nr:hypothetical protein [Solirubrobacteraceae bacterium]